MEPDGGIRDGSQLKTCLYLGQNLAGITSCGFGVGAGGGCEKLSGVPEK